MLALALSAAAWAYTPAGFGVPEPLGGMAGPSAPGALGVAYTPAAAHPMRAEWALDLGFAYSDLNYTLAWAPDEPVASAGAAVAPSLAAAIPIGDFGVGFAFFPLIARGGGEPAPADAARRFYSFEGSIQLLEIDGAVAWQPGPRWTIGAGPRVGLASVNSHKALETGAMLGQILGLGEEAPIGQPFLEGTQSLTEHTGVGVGWIVGVRFDPENGPSVDLSVRSRINAEVTGPLVLVLSNDLPLTIDADVTTDFPFPAAAFLSTEMPLGRASVLVEVSWIGWSSMGAYQSNVQNFSITSEDATMRGILESYGVTEAEFLEEAGAATVTTGMRDVINTGGAIVVPASDTLEWRVGVWNYPAAVPDAYAHPSNLDFHSVDVRAAAAWTPRPRWTFGVTGDVFVTPTRDIEETLHDWISPGTGGSLVPSGAGTYSLSLYRLGLTVIFRHGREAGG